MECNFTRLAYQQTGYFSKIITDYLDGADTLRPFYQHPVSLEGMQQAIQARAAFSTNRPLLVQELTRQYEQVLPAAPVEANLQKLSTANTFTICTAHQPAIFTGTLYFIYKILHTIRLAETLKKEMPQYDFVPVYYMGSEDADLEELGKVYLNGEKLVWDTKQTGAVGRMSVKGLDKLLHRIEGELSVLPFGQELISLLKECYLDSADVQTATFKLLHRLFGHYGLVVVIADTPGFKKAMLPVFEEDLFQQRPSAIVADNIQQLSQHYKVQANPRPINLFYLRDHIRNRIERQDDHWVVVDTDIRFTGAGLREELATHPERFSPNVILRGLFQETILPDIAFVGGGGETAYWLELKHLFEHYGVPYPMLVLRNSFLFIEQKWRIRMEKLQLQPVDLFQSEQSILNQLVLRNSNGHIRLEKELAAAQQVYDTLKVKAGQIDASLGQHIEALRVKTVDRLEKLEKKLLRAARKKHTDEQRQVAALKQALFPLNGLQERIDNFMPFYAKYGPAFIDLLYRNSLSLEQEFVVLTEQ